jgi:hypothetical protein
MSVRDNVVADQNYSRVFEIGPYRMPAANMEAVSNILWNTTQRHDSNVSSSLYPGAYTSSCASGTWQGPLSPETATMGELLGNGDGTGSQRTMRAQYGFSAAQLAWPVVTQCDRNFASDMSYLRSSQCRTWDRNSVELLARPFSPVGTPRPWHSRTYEDYAIASDSDLVTKHGFTGNFDVSEIGLTSDFAFEAWETAHKRRDAQGLIQAERYDRTKNLWTLAAQGLGSGTASHNGKEPAYTVPAGSWARYDGVDFGAGGHKVRAVALATSMSDGANVRFQLGSPDASGQLLASLPLRAGGTGWAVSNGSAGDVVAPAGIHSVFMVFEKPEAPPPAPPDGSAPHRYWRLLATPGDFNHSFFNTNWDVCQMQLFGAPAGRGPNLATDPSKGIASSGKAAAAFNGISNCTQWDGRGGATSNMWKPAGNDATSAWLGYDFGAPTKVESIQLKQFPNQYCAATPALQHSDDKVNWQTKFRLQCSSECPNNATGAELEKGWVLSPGKGTVAPMAPPAAKGIGGIVDWFSFRPE